MITETDVVDPETYWMAFSQCGECGEPDRVMNLSREYQYGLCARCAAKLGELS